MPKWRLLRGDPDGFQHVGQVVLHRLVREADNPIPRRGEDRLAFRVPFTLVVVNSTVELDGQTAFRTAEGDNE